MRFQGNWIPHKLRPATEDGIFFVGDSAGHCLPLTAEGIRTALYFGIACGRELRSVLEGAPDPRAGPDPLLGRSATRTSGSSAGCCARSGWSRACGRPLLNGVVSSMRTQAFVDWAFGHYLRIAPPEFVTAAPPPRRRSGTAEPIAA